MKFSVNNKLVYSFQVKYDKVSPIIQYITRNFPGIFENFLVISEKKIVEKLKISLQEVQNQLKFLEQNGIIDINWSNSLPKVTFLHERLPCDYIRLTPEVYQLRKERAVHRWKKAKDYLLLPHCREQFMLAYFGQDSAPCGKCDYCKSTSLVSLSKKLVVESIIKLLSEKSYSLQMLYDELNTISPHSIDEAIHHLTLEELIDYSHPYYSLNHKS
jgi:ATP-dependent DNA helicase RecQ